MYIPSYFRIDDRTVLHDFMRQHSFAIVVTERDGAPFVSHLPLLLDASRGENGVLLGHMARGNPQWRDLDPRRDVLAIFQGPHAYVSPTFYADQTNVPTWNYSVVHAYGRPRLIEEPEEVYRLLKELVDAHEASFERPWSIEGVPRDSIDRLARAIVAFEIDISRLEGKFKLSQNRAPEDQLGATAALRSSPDPSARATGELMARILPVAGAGASLAGTTGGEGARQIDLEPAGRKHGD